MAVARIADYLKLVPAVKNSPHHSIWFSYDEEADTFYINFKKPSQATDSELTENDVIMRYEGDELVGLTVLHASRRSTSRAPRVPLVREKAARKYGKGRKAS